MRVFHIYLLSPNVPDSQDGGKGAAVQYRHVHLPRAIDRFVTKDSHHKVTHTHPAEVRIAAVISTRKKAAAYSNHGRMIEDS